MMVMVAEIVGMLIISMAPLPAPQFHEADGSCVADRDMPDLAERLHSGDYWPYGRCDAQHFRLPAMSPKNPDCDAPQPDHGCARTYIRVKP